MQNYQINVPQAIGLTPAQQRAGFNTAMADAHASADPRFNMKPLDRVGMSRGKGQAMQAGIASARNLADGVARAYGQQAQDAVANAGVELGNQRAEEGFGLNVSGIDAQNRYAAALDALQRQQMQQAFTQNILGGLLGGGPGQDLTGFLGF